VPNLGAIVTKNLQNFSISVPFGQLNSILRRLANSAQNSVHEELQNPGIPTFTHYWRKKTKDTITHS